MTGGWPTPHNPAINAQRNQPDQPIESQGQQDRQTGQRHGPLSPAPQGIGDMAAVELADRKEIEGGDEETEPGGKADRVEHHVSLRR